MCSSLSRIYGRKRDFLKICWNEFFHLEENSRKKHNNRLLKLPKKMGNFYGHRNVRQNIIDDLTQRDHITPMKIPSHINCNQQRIAFGIKTTLLAKPTVIKANTKTSLIFTSTFFILRKSQMPSHSIIANWSFAESKI